MSEDGERREMGAVQIVHARSDRDISWRQTGEICAEVLGANGCEFGDGEEEEEEEEILVNWKEEGRPRFRVQVVEHGGEFPLPCSALFYYSSLLPVTFGGRAVADFFLMQDTTAS